MNNIAKPILRILSGLIDLTLFIIPSTYLVYRLSYSSNIENVLDRLWPIIILVLINNMIMVTINSFFISQFGGTVGKLLTGTRIVNPNGQNLSFWRAFFRNQMGYMVSGAFLWLGFLWIFFDKEVRAWHDMIVDSYVVIVSKQTYILGVFCLIIITSLNILLINFSISNFKDNSTVYTELIEEVTKSIEQENK